MRRAFPILSAALVAIAISLPALAPPAQAQFQPAVPDSTHYWSWSLGAPYPIPDQVAFHDQFFPNYMPLTNLVFRRLLNPVVKYRSTEVTPVRNPLLHYTWYDVQPPYRANRLVTIYDQFFPQGFTANVDSAAFLLVPASKVPSASGQPPPPPPPPGEANHYMCYHISPQPMPNVVVGLSDEFRSDQNVPIYEADFLCTPCWKLHNGVQWPTKDDITHLVLYRVIDPFNPVAASMADQFLQMTVQLYQTDTEYLALPAIKQLVTGTKNESWGRLKMLYR
jgi:hypothetical protein